MEELDKSVAVCCLSSPAALSRGKTSPMCDTCVDMLKVLNPDVLPRVPRVQNENFLRNKLPTIQLAKRLSIDIWHKRYKCTMCARLYYEYGHYQQRSTLEPVIVYCSILPDTLYIWTGASPSGERALSAKHWSLPENIEDRMLGFWFTKSSTLSRGFMDSERVLQHEKQVPCKISHPKGMIDFLLKHKAIIDSWTAICGSQHDCLLHNGALPTRLVMVGLRVSETKLVYSQNIPASADRRYISLSHCWGPTKFLTLTRANHDVFLKKIPVQSLTTTFKEALTMCRLLGVSYIWIDSLCIIQDSENGVDWKKEAPKMSQVYRNSFLNLAASSSYKGADGLFQPCVWPLYHPCWFQTGKNEWWTAVVRDSYPPLDGFTFSDQPLHQRGWVMQELFLAPRTLHFTQDGLVWQCKKCVWSEFAPASLDPSLSWRMVTGRGGQGFVSDTPHSGIALVFHAISQLSKEKLEDDWYSIARMYVMSMFTYDSDRAMALIGMSRMFEEAFKAKGTDTEYVWGFWTHRIIQDLTWEVASKVRQHTRTLKAAPSWSWMTMLPEKRGVGDRALFIAKERQDKHIGLHGKKLIDLAHVSGVGDRLPLTEDGTARAVSNADFIRMTGPLITVRATRSRDLYIDYSRGPEEDEDTSPGVQEYGHDDNDIEYDEEDAMYDAMQEEMFGQDSWSDEDASLTEEEDEEAYEAMKTETEEVSSAQATGYREQATSTSISNRGEASSSPSRKRKLKDRQEAKYEEARQFVEQYGPPSTWTESYKYLHLQHQSQGNKTVHLGRGECYAYFDRVPVSEIMRGQRQVHDEVWLILYAEPTSIGDKNKEYNFHGLILEPRNILGKTAIDLDTTDLADVEFVRTGVIHLIPLEDTAEYMARREVMRDSCKTCRREMHAGKLQNVYHFLSEHLVNESWSEIAGQVTIY